MLGRKLKRIEKVILIGFGTFALALVGYWLLQKAPNRAIYFPQDYEGWVNIYYEVQDAPVLAVKDGLQQLEIPASGILRTSASLETGWRRDEYFWKEGAQTQSLPKYIETPDGYGLYLHAHGYFSRSHLDLIDQIAPGQDTVLWDGTFIERDDHSEVNYSPGRKTIEQFYLSTKAEPIQFVPPPNPQKDALEDTENREIRVN